MKRVIYLLIFLLFVSCNSAKTDFDYGFKETINKSMVGKVYDKNLSNEGIEFVISNRNEFLEELKINLSNFILIEHVEINVNWSYRAVLYSKGRIYLCQEKNINLKKYKKFKKMNPTSIDVYIIDKVLENRIDIIISNSEKAKMPGSSLIVTTNKNEMPLVYKLSDFSIIDDKGNPLFW